MSKLIEKDGKFYRMRRGKLVEIPNEWVGKVPHGNTMRKRNSHLTRKAKMSARNWNYPGNKNRAPRHDRKVPSDQKAIDKQLDSE